MASPALAECEIPTAVPQAVVHANPAPGENVVSLVRPDKPVADPSAMTDQVTPVAFSGSYRAAPAVYTQSGPEDLRFDFNDGLRIAVPVGRTWQVRARDTEADLIIFDMQVKADGGKPGTVASVKKYFLPLAFEIYEGNRKVFEHQLDLKDKPVLIHFPVGTLGDLMGWFPYAVKFERKHKCKLTVAMGAPLIELFEKRYPQITFQTPEQIDPAEFYATYRIGLFFEDWKCEKQPCDFRYVGLHRTAGHILGVDPEEERPLMVIPDDRRPIEEPYVVIATQSTTQSKYWNHVDGWRETIKFLKESGYRVICIDQKPSHGNGVIQNHIPHGCEDQTGSRPLAERARWIKHAEFFIGLSSGLSWLAWATGVPVVMISGFTHPNNEFKTPYRVINYHACNSCWNDPRVLFDHKDFMWCPRKAGQAEQFECTRLITPGQVRNVIKTIPGFAARRTTKAVEV